MASLVVVLVLFFVVSLMAAYTSRNLIFEQKTSANQARSTLAFEAADAGVEWALTQLNGGQVGDTCVPQAGAASFQQRYLAINTADGTIAPVNRATGLEPTRWPTCVFDGSAWRCVCQGGTTATPVTTGMAGAGPFPAFRVWPASLEPVDVSSSPWLPLPVQFSWLMPLRAVGCTRLPEAASTSSNPTCLGFLPRSDTAEGTSALQVMAALRSGLAVPPSAAITARGTVTPAAAPGPLLVVRNTDPTSGGFTVSSGGAVNKSLFNAQSLPGTPGDMSFADKDARLASLETPAAATTPPALPALTSEERMFVSIFGMKRTTYQQQPGLRECVLPCSATSLQALATANPNRVLWVEGNLTLNASVGSAAAPLLLVVNGGTLTLADGVTLTGFVYLTGGTALPNTSTVELTGGAATIQGALAAEGNLVTTAASSASELTVNYDRPVLDLLRTHYGSWVRLPGGWRDFKGI